MINFGEKIGQALHGGEVLTLVGDIGAGKTTLVKGIARGMKIEEDVQSPSYTISRVYEAPNTLRLAHYDFYRLDEAGILSGELVEDLNDPQTVTIIEWSDIVRGVLPKKHTTINIKAISETEREVDISGSLGDLT